MYGLHRFLCVEGNHWVQLCMCVLFYLHRILSIKMTNKAHFWDSYRYNTLGAVSTQQQLSDTLCSPSVLAQLSTDFELSVKKESDTTVLYHLNCVSS